MTRKLPRNHHRLVSVKTRILQNYYRKPDHIITESLSAYGKHLTELHSWRKQLFKANCRRWIIQEDMSRQQVRQEKCFDYICGKVSGRKPTQSFQTIDAELNERIDICILTFRINKISRFKLFEHVVKSFVLTC